jgi:hypothetical protein
MFPELLNKNILLYLGRIHPKALSGCWRPFRRHRSSRQTSTW